MDLYGACLSPNSKNIKKKHPEYFFKFSQKNFFLNFVKCNFLAWRLATFLYLGKWNFLAPRLKTFLYFSKKSFFLFFTKWNLLAPTVKKISEGNFPCSKNKKSIFLKDFFCFSKWKFFALKSLIKRFYAPNKFPLEETGCLSNHHFSLTVEVSSFLIHILWLRGNHVTPEVTNPHFSPNSYLWKQRIPLAVARVWLCTHA